MVKRNKLFIEMQFNKKKKKWVGKIKEQRLVVEEKKDMQ